MINSSSDKAILVEIGERIARYRLNKNLTQEALAAEAGVSRATIVRIERGSSTQMTNFIRVIRVLGLIDNLEALLPEPQISPLQQVKMAGKTRQRASSETRSTPTIKEGSAETWQWGDQE